MLRWRISSDAFVACAGASPTNRWPVVAAERGGSPFALWTT
jgi:hypothetical protein